MANGWPPGLFFEADVQPLNSHSVEALSSLGVEAGEAAEWQKAWTVPLSVDALACAPLTSPALEVATMLESICGFDEYPWCGQAFVPLLRGVPAPIALLAPVPLALVALVAPLYLDSPLETALPTCTSTVATLTMPAASRPLAPASSARPDSMHSWRKYGQKKVFGIRFPVEYYRCFFQGCPARKRITGGFTFLIGGHSAHALSHRTRHTLARDWTGGDRPIAGVAP